MGLVAFKKQRYLYKCVQYEMARNLYCEEKDIDISSLKAFSAMDDVNGYNESIAIPTVTYVVDIFKSYIKDNKIVFLHFL